LRREATHLDDVGVDDHPIAAIEELQPLGLLVEFPPRRLAEAQSA